MAAIGIIRCERNADKCPLTGCLKSATNTTEAFSWYDAATVMGVFTCKCPGDNAIGFAKILQKKGAEAIHFCTCTFSHKEADAWVEGQGLCVQINDVIKKVAHEISIPCVKGTAHLPNAYKPETIG